MQNDATVIGISILSLIAKGTSSIIVAIITEKIRTCKIILEKKIDIISPDKKKDIDPCNDLLNNLVFY